MPWPLPHRFTSELEPRFQRDYYTRILPGLRLVATLLSALILVDTVLATRVPTPFDYVVGIPQLLFWLLLLGLTPVRGFDRVWQPVLVGLGWLMAGYVLGHLAPLLNGEIVRVQTLGRQPPTIPQEKFYFSVQFAVLAVSLATLRLQFRWAALLYAGLLAFGTWAFLAGMPRAPEPFLDPRFVFLPGSFLICALLLGALTQEQLARRAFMASHELEAARDQEKREREQTEGKLHVLAQAMGGVVHDLGNPLNVVQIGAQSMAVFLEDEPVDRSALREFSGAITSGVEMLNYLRLSLIEQTRVLEGKPIRSSWPYLAPRHRRGGGPLSSAALPQRARDLHRGRGAGRHGRSDEDDDCVHEPRRECAEV